MNDEANRGVAAIAVAVGDPDTREAEPLHDLSSAIITAGERDAIIQGLLIGARRTRGDPRGRQRPVNTRTK